MNWFSDFRVLLLGLWLGAACFFSFAVAPGAFAVLPTRELAGAVVNRMLSVVNYSGLIIGSMLLATSFLRRGGIGRINAAIERGALFLLTAACAVGQFVIAARLSDLRRQIGRPIDEIAVSDPLRVAFNSLHGYSVTVLLTAMIAALLAFFLIAGRARKSNDLPA